MARATTGLTAIAVVLLIASAGAFASDMVLVEGGAFVMQDTALGGSRGMMREVKLDSFLISEFEVTQGEFEELMGFNPSFFSGKNLPVEQVNWYEAVAFCNAKSLAEGLEPVYRIDRNAKDPNNRAESDDLKWTVEWAPGANGYRLPTEAEWEFAARGGRLSKGYRYAGSDNHREVAVSNEDGKTLRVGSKKPNELGLYDISGNVWEWMWDWYTTGGSSLERDNPRGPRSGDAKALRSGS
jgi:sulfatase modifying factor 1